MEPRPVPGSEASDEPPKFIHLTYTPKASGANAKVAVVGKGLTFDSGGYNIKAGAGSMIEMMKFDMGGAGAVLGGDSHWVQTHPRIFFSPPQKPPGYEWKAAPFFLTRLYHRVHRYTVSERTHPTCQSYNSPHITT